MTLLEQFDSKFSPHLLHTNRWSAFKLIAEELLGLKRPVRIVETGTVREKDSWSGDGQSTLVWDWIIDRTCGFGISIDISAENCELAKSLCHRMYICQSDSIAFLSAHHLLIRECDLLYLDSFDWSIDLQAASSIHHIGELAAAWKTIPSGCLIAVDDCHSNERGKHVMVKKFFEMIGVAPVHESYVTVWRKP